MSQSGQKRTFVNVRRDAPPLHLVGLSEASTVAAARAAGVEVEAAHVAVAAHLDGEAPRQGVDDRRSHPVQPAAGPIRRG